MFLVEEAKRRKNAEKEELQRTEQIFESVLI